MASNQSRLFLGGSLEEIQYRNLLICLSEIKNFDFYNYLVLIISKLIEQKNTLTFVEFNSELSGINFLPKWYEKKKFIRHKNLSLHYRNLFYETLSDFNIQFKVQKIDIEKPLLIEKRYKKISQLVQDDLDEYCKTSILSIFGTHQTKSIEPNTKLTKFESYLINHMVHTFNQICAKFDTKLLEKFETVIVLNGRMPDQSAIRKTCDIQEKEIYFFEHGGQLRESFHFEKFMPQNVKQMQKTFLTRFSHSLEFLIPKVRGYIDNWLNERLDSGTKDKSERNGKISEITQGRGKKIALICTSSLNEHELYSGAKPNLSQAELIKCSIQKLQNEGFEVIMRIHPNEMNNHWINLVNLMKAVITFDIKIIYPWDALSTYDLVEIADIVVVWDSTIGIEAYLLGKPIFVLNDSFYSDILNIPRITIQDLEFSNKIFVPYETLKSRGILAAYLRLSNGYSIFDDMFNKEMLSALRKKYVSSSYIVNNINSDYADSNIMRFVSYASTLINLRFPIHLERKFRKIFGVRFSGFAMKIILRFLILGGKVA